MTRGAGARMPATEQTIVIAAQPERCFAVISDYARYAEFLPEMRQVTVERREADWAVVTFELDLMVRVAYTLRLFEQRPTGLRWTLERATLMKTNSGGWQLEDLGDGRTRASYRIELELKGLIPSSVTTRLAGTTLPSTLAAFKRRIEQSR